MLIDDIKKRALEAMKAGRSVEKDILRLVQGEIQTAEARAGSFSEEDAQGVVKRLIKANEETLSVVTDDAQRRSLEEELTVLRSLLPQTLSVDAIVEALAPVRDALRAASNDGQATGVAMKHLKAQGAAVNGKDVTAAVKKVRA